MTTGHILGLITGIIFGFLLQRGGVVRFEKQVGFLLLKDMTVPRFMLAAIMVGMTGIIILAQFDVLSLGNRPLNLGGAVVGAVLFGCGWSLTGLCPGTSLGAVGEGRFHALFAIAGMLCGAMLFAHSYGFISRTILSWKTFTTVYLPDVTGLPDLVVVAIFVAAALLLLRWLDKKGL